MQTALRLVNASNWTMTTGPQGTFYSATGAFPVAEALETNYGPFALLSVSPDGRSVTASRDHFGLEPFFYSFRAQVFVFGSSLPDVLKALGSPAVLNRERVLKECFECDAQDLNFSTETYYSEVFRVEPGTTISVNERGLRTSVFWSPELAVSPIQCAKDREYLEAFSHLLREAIQHNVRGHSRIGAECSGGLDSSAVLVGCRDLRLAPTLFSHVAVVGSEEQDDFALIRKFLLPMGWADVHLLDATDFDPKEVSKFCASLFAGPAPYLFFTLANNLHQAVSRSKVTLLLSGFGGDECATGHAIARAFFPEQISRLRLRAAWDEMRIYERARISPLRAILRMLRFTHPSFFRLAPGQNAASQRPYYKNIRSFESDLLTGHALRMRVEYSAIVARAYGFRYAYPFLYPPLVSFCLALPPEQKRRQGQGRFLVRQLLKGEFGTEMGEKAKIGGGIFPATLHACKQSLRRGDFADGVIGSTYAQYIRKGELREELKGTLATFMLESFQNTHAVSGSRR